MRAPSTSGLSVGFPGGLLPYVTLTGTCGSIGYGFQGVFVLKGVSLSSLSVLNRVSLHDIKV